MALGVSCLNLHIQTAESELPFATHLKRCTHSLTKISKDTLLQTFYDPVIVHHFSLFFGCQGLHVAKLLIVSTDVPVKPVFLLYPMDLFLKSED